MPKYFMKKLLWTGLLSALLNLNALASFQTYTFSSGFQNGGVIPNGSMDGLVDSRTISGISPTLISDIQITLNISGGYNGDLYAYLTHGTETVVLLNRVGVSSSDAFGYANAGLNIRLANAGENGNIHTYGGAGVPTGTYAPDGRAIDPLSSPGAFDADGTGDFSAFNNLNPNGAWTLFISDVVGDEGSPGTLLGWSLEITAVPEPVHVALGIFGGLFLVIGLSRNERVRKFFVTAAR